MTKVQHVEQQVTELPVEDQLRLADSILERYAKPEDYQLSPELREELRARLAEAKADPEAGLPWKEVKADILKTL